MKKFDYTRLNYIPFVGWIYPFAAKNDDKFVYFHAKQGLAVAFIFTLVPIMLTMLIFLSPAEVKIIALFLTLLIYMSHVLYFTLCIWGSVQMVKGESRSFPAVDRLTRKLDV